MMLAPDVRARLLRIARAALAEGGGAPARAAAAGAATADAATAGVAGPLAAGPSPVRAGGAFVTLRVDGQLRGCVGRVEADRPLVEIVRDVSRAAAAEDPRFPALRPAELPQVVIEVSVLGALEPCAGPEALVVGRHGVLVEQDRRRGLLLPQVAVEQGWSASAFVAQACRKAGLPPDAWRRGATLVRFEAEVFAEDRSRA